MNTNPDTIYQSAFSALLDLVQKVEQIYSVATNELSSPGPKALAGFLAIQHAEHMQDLRTHAAKYTVNRRRMERDDSACEAAWEEIRSAMMSGKRDVVIAACQLTERLVVRAYRLVINSVASHKRALDLVGRHLRELSATEAFVRTICSDDIAWQFDPPGTEGLLSSASRTESAESPKSESAGSGFGSSLRLALGKKIPAE